MIIDFKQILGGDKRSSTIKKNIVGSLLVKGLSILTSLALVPMTINYVNPKIYGIWLTLSSLVLWFNFFDIGFTLGLKNKLAEAIAKQDFEKGKQLVSTTYYMMVVIFLPLCLLLAVAIPYIHWDTVLNISPAYIHDVVTTLYILTFFLFLQMFLNVLSAVVTAYQKVALASLFLMLGQVLSLILIFILTKTCPPSLMGLAICISISPIIILAIASIYLYNSKMKEIAPSFKSVDKSSIRELFSMGIKFFIIQIQVIVLYQSTNIIISNIGGPESVTQYNIAYKYLGSITMVYNIILAPLWPAFTDAYTLKDYDWMQRIYKKMVYVYGLIALAIILLIIASPIVYKLWIGDSVSVPMDLTIIIAIFFLINSWDSLQVYMINGIGAVKLQTYVVLIGLVFHIPLAFFLSQYIDIKGVILSMIIINIIYSTVFTTQIQKIIHGRAQNIWIE